MTIICTIGTYYLVLLRYLKHRINYNWLFIDNFESCERFFLSKTVTVFTEVFTLCYRFITILIKLPVTRYNRVNFKHYIFILIILFSFILFGGKIYQETKIRFQFLKHI